MRHADPQHPEDLLAADATHRALPPDLSDVAASLHRRFDLGLGAATVDFQIHLGADWFAAARIRSFVLLFIRRFTGEALARG